MSLSVLVMVLPI